MSPDFNPMQNPSSDHSAQRLDAKAALLLVLHCNDSGEISPALELAFGFSGPNATTAVLPSEILLAEKIDGAGLLIRGRQAAVVWCSTGSLDAIKRIAEKFNARYAANWSGMADLHTPVPPTGESTKEIHNGSAQTGFSKFGCLLLLGLALATCSLHAENTRPAPPLVRSGAVLGNDLLERLAVAAKASGYHVEIADVRAQTDCIQLWLQGLVLTPPADHVSKPIRLPVVISIGRLERVSISLRAITRPSDQLPKGSAVRIVLIHTNNKNVIAEQTTNLVRGWNTPTLTWIADHDYDAGEFAIEIIPLFTGPIKVTLPQGLLMPSASEK